MILYDVFFAGFGLVFLKAMQQQHVIGGHYLWILPTSYGLAAAEIAIVLYVARDYGWGAWPWLGTGAGLGAVAGMWIHRRWLGKRKSRTIP